MNEPEYTSLGMWVAGGVMSLIGWVLRRNVNRMDEHDARLSELEKSSINDDKLERTIARIESKIDQTQTIVRAEIGELHRRIDDVVRPR